MHGSPLLNSHKLAHHDESAIERRARERPTVLLCLGDRASRPPCGHGEKIFEVRSGFFRPIVNVNDVAPSCFKRSLPAIDRRKVSAPGAPEFAQDPNLDSITKKWVYQALREITEQRMADDPSAWAGWLGSMR